MSKIQDKETRYFIDIDLKTGKILCWDYDQRHKLIQELANPNHHRIFITKGQFNKLVNHTELLNKPNYTVG